MSVPERLFDGAVSFPLSEGTYTYIQDALQEIDNKGNGTIMMALRGQPGRVRLFQVCKKDGSFRVDAAKELSNGKPELFALREATLQEAVNAVRDICVNGKEPTSEKWENVTKEMTGAHGR